VWDFLVVNVHFLQLIALCVQFYNKYIVIEDIIIAIICQVVVVYFAVSLPYAAVLFRSLIAVLNVCSISEQYNVHVDTGNGS